MSSLRLEEFIYQVKRELLDAQEKHEGEPAYLELQKVEIEVSLLVNKTANGKVSVYVAEIGSDVSKEQVQRVRMAFNVIDALPDAPPQKKGAKQSPTGNTPKKKVVQRGRRAFR
ncbi:MAG TPA: trypco2 family protein [Thermoanaerobaculia bacterium]|nr:trypco2 family protein [Thermoanaerobaculia bacterium]